MRTLDPCALALVLVSLAACEDDDPAAPNGSGGAAPSTVGVGGGTTSIGGAGGGGGAAPSLPCTPEALPGALDAGGWDARFTVAGVAGPDGDAPVVSDFARDIDGTVLAAGRFRWLGAERVEPLLRTGSGGATTWEPARDSWELQPPEFGGFSAVAVGESGELALATTGVTPQIWIDTGAGLEAVGDLIDVSSFFQYVRSLAWYDGMLWAAGSFTLTGGGPSNLAVWDGVSWSGAPNGAPDGAVYDLLVDDGVLFIGGAFDAVGGIPAGRVASWDGSAWSALDLDVPFPAEVFALAVDPGGTLVAGGTFSDDPDCSSHGGVATWNGTSWEMLGAGVSMPDLGCNGSRTGLVYDVTFHEGDLYVTGQFAYANGPATSPDAIAVSNFARWSDGEWQALDPLPTPGVKGPWVFFGTEGFGIVGQRLFSDDGRLLAGILAPGAGGVASQGLIAYENGAWVPQGPPAGLGLNADTAKLAVGGPACSLHALSNASHAEGQPLVSQVVRFDGDGWSALGSALPESLRCDAAIAVDPQGKVFVACFEDGGDAVEVLALEDDAWASIGGPDGSGRIRALAIDGRGVLWAAGGAVGDGGSGNGGFVARWEDGVWSNFVDANGVVTHIDFAPDGGPGPEPPMLLGGAFTSLGGAPFARVAHFDGTTFVPLGDGLARPVGALEYGRHGIYASEESDGISDVLDVGLWDGTIWVELATDENEFPPLVVSSVTRLLEIGETLIVAGTLVRGEFPPQERMVLAFDGTRFTWLGGGVAANFLSDAAVTNDALWFAGAIAEAGVGDDRVSTVGVARHSWAL